MTPYRDLLGDTICSPITPPGYSGVAVIRVSGSKAYKAIESIVSKKIFSPQSHKSYLTSVVSQNNSKIDQVLLTYFDKGHSFTGDETVEISCHGNPLIINQITKRLLENGCRQAERGEFSFRAYYNGKIDLIQAESIQDIVTSNNSKSSETFVDQLQGKLSDDFNQLKENLISAMAHLEASIDFVEQDIETAELSAVRKILNASEEKVSELLNSYNTGKRLQDDLKILILGNANAGKSSLFNKCIDSDRAIVTELAGTTRDLVTEQMFLGHNSVQFIDSAGLRETDSVVENIGIQKSLDQVKCSDVILFVVDIVNPGDLSFYSSLPKEKVIVVFNKIDLLHSKKEQRNLQNEIFKNFSMDLNKEQVSFVSSLRGQGVEEMSKKIENIISSDDLPQDSGAVITQARHFNHLTELMDYLSRAKNLVNIEESPDLISQELSLGLSELNQLLGKEYDDEVLDKIFSQFCIGK